MYLCTMYIRLYALTTNLATVGCVWYLEHLQHLGSHCTVAYGMHVCAHVNEYCFLYQLLLDQRFIHSS